MNNSEKILYLDDVHEIKNLKYRYFKACDNHNISEIEACFCDGDIHIDFENFGTFNTIQSMLKVYKEKSINDGQIESHFGKNPVINIYNHHADARWGLTYSMIDLKKSLQVNIQGFYLDEYLKHQNIWKIKSSIFKRLSTSVQKLN